jgi:ribosomal protein S20
MAQTILELQLKGVDEAKASMQGLSEEIVEQRLKQTELKGALKETKKALDAGTISEKDYTKAVAQNNIEMEKSKKIVRENSATLRQNIKVLDAQEGSLDQMRASLNLLQKEFGQLDQSTQEGAMAADAMKQRIQALDTAVKAQEESIGDHRRSVGDYGKALQGLGQYFPILSANISATAPFLGDFGEKINKFAPLIGVMGQNLGFAGGKMNEFVSSASEGPSILKRTQDTISKMPKGLKALRAGFVAATSGIYAAVKASLAFLATPIGLALGAVAAATAGAIALFSRAKRQAAEEASKSVSRIAAAAEEGKKIAREMKDTLADSLTLGEAQIAGLKKTFVDAFAELDSLFQAAGEDGGEQYGDAFNERVDAALGRSQETLKAQYEAERKVLVQLAEEAQAEILAMADTIQFSDIYGTVELSDHYQHLVEIGLSGRTSTEWIEFYEEHGDSAFTPALESVQTLGKRIRELDQTFKFDIALSEELAEQTKKTAESYDATAKSVEDLAEEEKKRQEEERKSEELRRQRREERRKAEEERKKMIDELLDKESERTLTEEELIDKRFYDKLRELKLDGDITKMTEKELELRTALYAKYNDELQVLRDKKEADELADTKASFDKNIKAIEDGLALELLIRETAMLNELRNQKLTEEQKLQLQKDFQDESLELQRDALIKQIELIEGTLGKDETTTALEELRNALANVNLEIQNAANVLPEDQSLMETLGLDEERVAKANLAMETLGQSLDIMSQSMQVQQENRLNAIDEQVKQGVITEEEAARKKERIQKEFARKQQKVDITQAVINTALAVTSALATKPFLPMGLIAAGIATATGAAQVASIKAQKFSKGGLLSGPSHAQGGIPMFSKGGAFYGEAEGGEAVLTKGVMANPALARMASAINVAGGGVPFFANGGVLDPIQSATPTDRAADIIASGLKSRQPVLVVEQLRERENSVDVIESLRTIG